MSNAGAAYLEFDSKVNQLSKKKELRHGLSVAVQVGNTLWVTNDETISLERLSLQGIDNQGIYKYGEHKQFPLGEYLSLPVPPSSDPNDKGKFEEADVEGLDYRDGYLWLVGSHSLKRKKVNKKDSEENSLKNLSKVSCDGNRFLLARIPLVKEGNTYTLKDKVEENGVKRTAAQLRGDANGNDLTEALKKDEHLNKFLDIPGKDNGFDIEGLAVAGNLVFLGLRGPVLRGWAVLLELQLKEVNQDGRPVLKLESVKKRFLELGGLGIRDLNVQGSDLLILAGPTMDLDGPVTVYRWQGGAGPKEKSFVFRDALLKVRDVPYGQGDDHAEGMTLFSPAGGREPDSLLVVYDAASRSRQFGNSGVKADIFLL